MNGFLGIIRIGLDPDLAEWGPFILSWHGFFTFVAVVVAVALVTYWVKRDEGIIPDTTFSIAIWCIIGGVIGSRVLHVIDHLTDPNSYVGTLYKNDPGNIFYVWQGGIAIIGAISGGWLAGIAYMSIRNQPWFINFWNSRLSWLGGLAVVAMPSRGRLSDIAAPALLLAMAIGRIGDIINGEHFSLPTSLPWGFVYTHEQTQALYQNMQAPYLAIVSQHPAIVYEMILDLVVFGIIWFVLKGRLRPHGMLFASYAALYSLGRFFISFIRLDDEKLMRLDLAQVCCLIILAVSVFLLISKAQVVKRIQRPGGRTQSEVG